MASITMSKFYKKSSMDSDYKKSAVAEFIAPDTQDTEPEDSQQRQITPADSTGTRPIEEEKVEEAADEEATEEVNQGSPTKSLMRGTFDDTTTYIDTV